MNNDYDYLKDPAVGCLLDVIEATAAIARIPEMNGPAGRQLGAYIQDRLKGRAIADLTIRELTAIIEESSRDYNETYRRAAQRLDEIRQRQRERDIDAASFSRVPPLERLTVAALHPPACGFPPVY